MKNTDLVSLFEQSLRGVESVAMQESGTVLQISDNVCTVYGLERVLFGELVRFEGGNTGIVFQLDQEVASIFLLDTAIGVKETEVVTRTGELFKVPVGDYLLGRVINAQGHLIDGLEHIDGSEHRPIETSVAGIMDRSPVNESLETGFLAIDALIPVGKGQRELIIGNRATGKTSIAINTILHQKGKNVICVYVSIGQRQASLARFVQTLRENDALDYCVIVSAEASESVLNRYLAPYVGCTISEYFKDQKKDVLIVYDDLSNHAIAFREMSLLLRRAPGREAYPGDVFFLHSRLLERAGKFLAGGSITALPIVQIQADDITAYIPTNLISITDGQIFLDTKLFNQGFRPAVNAELSVSRVGGAAQTKAVKKMVRSLRLELAQYHELLDFAQFGAELDEVSSRQLERGKRAVEILKQPQHVMYSFVDQSLMLFLLRENFIDSIPLNQVSDFVVQFVSYAKSVYHEEYAAIEKEQDISDEVMTKLHAMAREFSMMFSHE